MAIGDFYELTIFQLMRGQVMMNVFHYEQTAGVAGAASSLLAGWQSAILPAMADVQSNEVTYDRILVQNLVTDTDNAEDITPTPVQGAQLASPAPLRLAMTFRSTRPDLSKRYSYKRIGGVASNFLTGYTWNIAGAQVAALAALLDANITGGANTWKPVQLRLKDPVTGNPVLLKNYDITGNYIAIAEPSTQNSRTFGRGA